MLNVKMTVTGLIIIIIIIIRTCYTSSRNHNSNTEVQHLTKGSLLSQL